MKHSSIFDSSRVFGVLFIGLVILLHAAAGIAWIVGYDPMEWFTERRELAKMPSISDSKTLHSFPKSFDAHFRDSFGFRKVLLGLYVETRKTIFGSTGNDQVKFYGDGWFGSRNLEKRIDPEDYEFRLQARRLRILIEERIDYCKENGKLYVFFVIPNTWTVLSSRFGLDEAAPSMRSLLLREITKAEIEGYFDLTNSFRSETQPEELFLKTDTHWNWTGAYVGYRLMNSRLRELEGKITPAVGIEHFEQEKFELKSGTYSRLIGVPLSETVKRIRFAGSDLIDPVFIGKHNKHIQTTSETGGDLEALVLGDSFMRGLVVGGSADQRTGSVIPETWALLAHNFSKATFVDFWRELDKEEQFPVNFTNFGTSSIIIQQIVERRIPLPGQEKSNYYLYTQNLPEVRQARLKKLFATKSNVSENQHESVKGLIAKIDGPFNPGDRIEAMLDPNASELPIEMALIKAAEQNSYICSGDENAVYLFSGFVDRQGEKNTQLMRNGKAISAEVSDLSISRF